MDLILSALCWGLYALSIMSIITPSISRSKNQSVICQLSKSFFRLPRLSAIYLNPHWVALLTLRVPASNGVSIKFPCIAGSLTKIIGESTINFPYVSLFAG